VRSIVLFLRTIDPVLLMGFSVGGGHNQRILTPDVLIGLMKHAGGSTKSGRSCTGCWRKKEKKQGKA
jgi:hypothetical protein